MNDLQSVMYTTSPDDITVTKISLYLQVPSFMPDSVTQEDV